ncbi:MAG: transposase [Tepidisphaeraceae bacterium]
MRATIGYHFVKSTHGTWLPGDQRGHWSEAWDEQIGFIEPHMLHPGDPVRLRMARERMKHPEVRLTREMIRIVEQTIARCVDESPWSIVAGAIERTHTHLLITYTTRDIDKSMKWLTQEMTKAVHRQTTHQGPVWSEGKWLQFIFDDSHWRNTVAYIERHNVRRGLDPRPYSFLNQDRG